MQSFTPLSIALILLDIVVAAIVLRPLARWLKVPWIGWRPAMTIYVIMDLFSIASFPIHELLRGQTLLDTVFTVVWFFLTLALFAWMYRRRTSVTWKRITLYSLIVGLVTTVVVSLIALVASILMVTKSDISDANMAPTFRVGDSVAVERLSLLSEKPKRGETVAFHPRTAPERTVIGRIVGLPGEHLRISDGELRIVDAAHPEGVALEEPYLSREERTSSADIDGNDIQLDADSYYVLGDARAASAASGAYGRIASSSIIGRVSMFTRARPTP